MRTKIWEGENQWVSYQNKHWVYKGTTTREKYGLWT